MKRGHVLLIAAAAVILGIAAVVALAELPLAVDWSLIGVQAAVSAYAIWLARPRWGRPR